MASGFKISNFTVSRRILIAILFLALIIRLPGIFWGLPIIDKYAQLYHPDEGKVIWGAMSFPEDIFTRINLIWPTGLHYLIGILVLPLKSLVTFSILQNVQFRYLTFIVGRLISIAHGVGAVALIYILGKRLYNIRTGLIAAIILTVSIYHVRNSSMATPDVATSFWVIVVLIALDKLGHPHNLRNYLFLAITTGILVGIKYNGAIVAIPIGFYFLKLFLENPSVSKFRETLKSGLFVGSLALITFLFTTPTILVNINAQQKASTFLLSWLESHSLPLWNLQVWVHYFYRLVTTAGLPIAIFILIGLFYSFSKEERLKSLPLALLVISYLGFLSTSLIPRYMITILPVMALLAARPLDKLYQKDSKFLRWGATSLLVIAVIYNLAENTKGIYLVLNDTRSQAAEYIEKNIPSGVTIGNVVVGNLARSGWHMPGVDGTKYLLVDNLEKPEYVILSSLTFTWFQSALTSGHLSENFIWDQKYSFWPRNLIPEPEVFLFYDSLLNNRGNDYEYRLIKVFERDLSASIEFPPPEIRIYQRIDN